MGKPLITNEELAFQNLVESSYIVEESFPSQQWCGHSAPTLTLPGGLCWGWWAASLFRPVLWPGTLGQCGAGGCFGAWFWVSPYSERLGAICWPQSVKHQGSVLWIGLVCPQGWEAETPG